MNKASRTKHILRKGHYAVESATDRPGYGQQYDFQLYPTSLKKLLADTGRELLKIIPIGDRDVAGDFWVIPFALLEDVLVDENLTKGVARDGTAKTHRWRFHIEKNAEHIFVVYPGNRRRVGQTDVQRFYGADLPLPPEWQKLLDKE